MTQQVPIRETRGFRIEVRDLDKVKGEATIIPMVYNVKDSYSTTWLPGVFTESLVSGRTIPYVWSHDWKEPIGRTVDYTDNAAELQLRQKFDNFDDVPRARQAFSQLQSGTLSEHSVGFTRREWLAQPTDEDPWAESMVRADLDETSVVIAGAVPGTKTLGVRGLAYLDRSVAERAVRTIAENPSKLNEVLESLGLPTDSRAVWTSAFKNSLADAAFAIVLPGGMRDNEGKTMPRSLRWFPHHTSSGALEASHLENALARVEASDLTDAQKRIASAHLDSHAKALALGSRDAHLHAEDREADAVMDRLFGGD